MLTLRNLTLQRGGKPLFESASLIVHAGKKVGIIGANGSGKSTLLALVRGELHPDGGDLELPPRLTVAHVAQETPAVTMPAIEYVLDGDVELRQLETAITAAETAHDGTLLGDLHARYEDIDGYTARARAGRLMAGLGFAADELQRPVADFSGGWRMRLNLARALMCRSDLLLLDEPTNHLDLDAVLWLEQWLSDYRGTLLLISHDKEFLDTVVDHVAHLEHRQIVLYKGNYSQFEEQRSARLAAQQAAFAQQQGEIAQLQRFIDRFRAKATKARQVQGRLKALDRMARLAPAHLDSPFHFSFPTPDKLPNPLLVLDQAAVGYEGKIVLGGIRLNINPGTRLGLLGPNGAGKSTLIKLLGGLLPILQGALNLGQGLQVGYFAQHQLEQLRQDWSPLAHLQALDTRSSDQELRDFLGNFGFNGAQALTPAANLSGGEKARLVLALLVRQRPNLLLLDEPTNHLDLEMRHALTLALQDYSGALILVSHDRHLLRTTTDAYLLVAEGHIAPFDGDLEDYRHWLKERQDNNARDPYSRESRTLERREQRREAAERRNQLAARRRPLERALRDLEQRMETLSKAKAAVANALAEPETYQDANKARLKDLLLRQGQIDRELALLEEQWLEWQERLEAVARY